MKTKLTLFIAALLLGGFSMVACQDDESKRHDTWTNGAQTEIPVQSVEWKSDLKNGIEWSLGDNSLNVANRMNITPETATNQKQTFTSSNPSVATVSEFGQVTTAGLGTTSISVMVDGQSTSFSLEVVVAAAIKVRTIGIASPNVSIYLDETKDVSAMYTILPDNAADKSITYESQNEAIALVSAAGVISGVAPGSTTVTVTANDGSGVFGTFNVEIKPLVAVESIDAPNKNIPMENYTTKDLKTLFTVLPANAANKTVVYESKTPAIVTVDNATGIITAIGEGAGRVSVTSVGVPSVSIEFNVTVTAFYGDYTRIYGLDNFYNWTILGWVPGYFGGEDSTMKQDGMLDGVITGTSGGTWTSFVKPGQTHAGSGSPGLPNPSIANGGYCAFTVDTKVARTVNYFRISWRDVTNLGMRFVKFGKISGSNDNVNFTDIASNVTITDATTAANRTSPDVTIPASTYRYFKFECRTSDCFYSLTTNKTVSIAEFYLGRAQ